MRHSFIAAISMCMSLCVPAFAEAPDFSGEQFEAREGFFTLQVDTDTNKVYAVLPEADEDGVVLRMIHTAALTAGLGSNPVGFDRGNWNPGEIMVFRQIGDQLILEVENLSYRASP